MCLAWRRLDCGVSGPIGSLQVAEVVAKVLINAVTVQVDFQVTGTTYRDLAAWSKDNFRVADNPGMN